jgi:hypothetical protein
MNSLESFPIWLPFQFIGLWLFVCALFAVISGWVFLARRYRATDRPEGKKVRGQVKQIGIVPEREVTHMIVSRSGLYLYESILFRFLHPPLLIPWPDIRLKKEFKTLWWYYYRLNLGSITTITVTRKAYNEMRQHMKEKSGIYNEPVHSDAPRSGA